MPKPTARERLLNYALAALPNEVAFERTEQLADAYEAEHCDQVLTEAAEHLDRIADETEAQVAALYGKQSGIGPGSAGMVRECARTLRDLAARAAADAPHPN